ncbi:RHS repeat protein [Wenzhouxiangella sp. AB-CW3]|uniref:RHS repeat domain-containing protein n=1 Tax=Wenzhouxiangella sp. AB-CW3 TaxID=2771012 RepID=UPI00168B0A5D|nr:RHS repeat protein [Wenzhouxiangella sp. AB-CW3]
MLGRTLTRTLPEGQTETFQYDLAGQRTAHTDFKGQTVEFFYDELSRPIRTEYSNDVVVNTRYTPSGQVWEIEVTCTPAACAEAGKDPGITSHHYDERDRLTRIDYPDNRWIEYAWDEAGNRIEVRTDNQRTRYSYDALNRKHTVTACANESCSEGAETVYNYNPVGSLQSVEHANATATEAVATAWIAARSQANESVGSKGLTWRVRPEADEMLVVAFVGLIKGQSHDAGIG